MTCKDCASFEKCVSLGYGDTEADSAELCCKGFKQKSRYREPKKLEPKESGYQFSPLFWVGFGACLAAIFILAVIIVILESGIITIV